MNFCTVPRFWSWDAIAVVSMPGSFPSGPQSSRRSGVGTPQPRGVGRGRSRTVSGCWSHRSTHINAATYCHQAKENVTPTYSAAYDMMVKKCMQNFGEENCRTVTPTTLERIPEMLARVEMVKDRAQWRGFSVNRVRHSGQLILSSVNHLVFQSVSQPISQ